ncbi:hypothetical protein NQK81_39235 [Amycolatopsis roodepoortensis]|uniref:hypothetical protein n=1 Tax=Amycolatopsis roodepoortensis TaxID=700274 RepID=UPI00214CBF4F|nr:hypothetical protein [Amycolatopsis roodepoortensis]UUV30735.1 hypothetical protein NQK81_39235 [Amycolatopsis roodepoortensis]
MVSFTAPGVTSYSRSVPAATSAYVTESPFTAAVEPAALSIARLAVCPPDSTCNTAVSSAFVASDGLNGC